MPYEYEYKFYRLADQFKTDTHTEMIRQLGIYIYVHVWMNIVTITHSTL